MLNDIIKFLSQENITFWIAIAGFLMSVATWIHTFVTQRKSLRFQVSYWSVNNKIALAFISIENLSRLPVAISRISLLCAEQTFECTHIPKRVREVVRRHGSEVIERREDHSMQMPIEIGSLGAVSGYVVFESDQFHFPADATQVTLVIGTNRGRSVQMTLQLP